MGSTSSAEARDPTLSEHLATSEEGEEGGEGRRRPRGGRESDSDSEVDEERGEEEDDQEQRRQENMSYYGDMLLGGDRFVDILGGMPRGDRLISRPPRVHQTRSVVCDVNLTKETLRLLPIAPSEEAPPATAGEQKAATLYQIRFNFDTNVECRIRIFFAAKETRDENNHLTGYLSRIKTEVPPLQFPAGLGQEYVQSISNPLDVSLFEESDLEYKPQTQVAPVIIVLEPLVTDGQQRVTSQTTFATLLKCSDDTFAIKAVKVKIEWCGATYIVHDIYGLDQSSDAGRECVICMTEARDTIVLPCRHMCLCRGCAEVLRYQTTKCPICRSLFTALLKVEVSKEGEESDEEEGSLVSKGRKKKRTDKGEKEEDGLISKKKKKDISSVVTQEQEGSSKEPSEDFHGRDVVITVAN